MSATSQIKGMPFYKKEHIVAKNTAGDYRLDDPKFSSEDVQEMDRRGSGKYWHRKPVEDEDNRNPYEEDGEGV